MHVTSCSVNPTTSCPGSSVTVTVKVQPGYFDIGTYDVRIYGRSGGSWSQIAQKTGTANPFGGEFTLTHTISIPSSAGSWYEIGAMDSGEGYAFPVKTTEVTLPPTSFYLGTISASPTSGYASLTVQFSHSGGYGFDIIRWNIYKGNDLISTRNGQSFSHTFGAPGYYYIYAIPIDRCGKEGPQKSLTVTVEERSTDCSNPYGRQGSYNCQGTTRVQCNNGAWTPIEYNSTQCGYVPPAQNCSNPYGTPGAYNCQGTTRVQCNNGAWTPIEYNSTQCGYVPPNPPPQQGCTNPSGVSGQVRCDGTTLLRCIGTEWVVIEENSADCGYVPPVGYDNCANPYGTHGSYRCSGTTRMQCNDGAWVVSEYNSQQCGYVPPTQGCTNPTGASGDTYCDGTTLKRCNGTSWLAQEYNSTQCGYVPPTPEPTSDNTLIYVGAGLLAAIGIGYALSRRK